MRRRTRVSEEGWLLSYADMITNLLLFFVVLLTASQLSRVKMQEIARHVSDADNPTSLENIKKEVDQKIKEAGMEKMVRSELTDEGLEFSLNSGVVFDVGSAVVRAEWDDMLSKLLSGLVAYSPKYRFAVEGHSDSTPIALGTSRFRSNWELSSARAMEVRQRMESVGIPRNKTRVEAYADTKGLKENELNGLAHDEVLARHRRVVVRMY